MAAADYKLCDICDRKTFYDCEVAYGDWTEESGSIPVGVGAWAVLCVDCSATHRIEIVETKTKTDEAKGGE